MRLYAPLKKVLAGTLSITIALSTFIVGAFSFSPAAKAAPSQLILPVSADATLIQAGDTGSGTAETLTVRSAAPNDNKRAVVSATLSGLPANATVTSAQLQLNSVDGPGDNRTEGIYRVNADTPWTEGTVKWSTINGHFAPTPTNDQAVVKNYIGVVAWDVTTDVTAFLGGTTNNGWVIKDENENGAIGRETVFASREYTPNQNLRGQLVISYNTPPAAPTLTKPVDNGWSNATENRKPLIQWQAAVDTQGDPLAYQLQVTTKDDAGFSNPVINLQENSVGQYFTAANGAVSYQTTTALTEGQSYLWRVRATDDPTKWDDAYHTSTYASAFTFGVDTTTPSAPQVSIRHSQVEFNWTAATDSFSLLKDYTVLRSDNQSNGFQVIKTGETGLRYVEDKTLTEGQYYYKVTANDNAGNAVDSDAILGVQDLTAPKSTLAGPTLTNNRTVNLTWTANDNLIGVKEVELFAIKEGGTWQSAGTFNTSPISFTTDSDGQWGFYLVATDKAGNREVTPVSAQVTTTIDTVAPAQPIILTATPSDGIVNLTWQPIGGGVDHVVVMYGTASGVYDFAVTLPGDATSAKIIGLQNGKTYYFAVAAYDAAGNKNASAEKVATPVAPTKSTSAIGGGVAEEPAVPSVKAAEKATPTPEASVTETPAVAGAATSPRNWSKILITLGIIVIALGAAVGGYYGYGWWMREDSAVPATTKRDEAAPAPRRRGRPRKTDGNNQPPSRW